MNYRICASVVFVMTTWLLCGQQYSWESGILAGIANSTGDIVEHDWGVINNTRPAMGIFVRYHHHPLYDFRFNAIYGRLSGSDLNASSGSWQQRRGFLFQTDIAEFSAQASWRPLGNSKPRFSPYVFAGAGGLFFDPKPDFSRNKLDYLVKFIEEDKQADYAHWRLISFLGIGVDTHLGGRWTLGAEVGLRPTYTDHLDGVSHAGNPQKKDWYGLGLLTLGYKWGSSDRDGDGIADQRDECPDMAGVAALGGCPDRDGDGVADAADACPYTPGKIALRGCPDTDGDGIADPEDECPDEAGDAIRHGCPYKDTDNDGIEDRIDQCPDVPGPVERDGCPAIDTDLDGILDEDDRCPTAFGIAIFKGCPDTDGDGIEDSKDACPDLFGVYANNGCPEEVVAAESAAALNRQYLTFSLRSTELERYSLLDNIATFMQQHPEYDLIIDGYADNELKDGKAAEQLSRNRALNCLRYLEQQGIASRRLQSRAFGARFALESPTEEEKQFNRRVEFTLYKQ